MDASLALRVFSDTHSEIFSGCLSWQDFFDCLKTYGNKKHLLVFFDHAGERNDKKDFYAALDWLLNGDDGSMSIVLLGRPWENAPPSFQKVEIDYFSMPQLADKWNLSDQTAVKVYCLTGAIPAMISRYDKELSFEENVCEMSRQPLLLVSQKVKRLFDILKIKPVYQPIIVVKNKNL